MTAPLTRQDTLEKFRDFLAKIDSQKEADSLIFSIDLTLGEHHKFKVDNSPVLRHYGVDNHTKYGMTLWFGFNTANPNHAALIQQFEESAHHNQFIKHTDGESITYLFDFKAAHEKVYGTFVDLIDNVFTNTSQEKLTIRYSLMKDFV